MTSEVLEKKTLLDVVVREHRVYKRLYEETPAREPYPRMLYLGAWRVLENILIEAGEEGRLKPEEAEK